MKVINKYGQLIESITSKSTVNLSGKDYLKLLDMAQKFEELVEALESRAVLEVQDFDEKNLGSTLIKYHAEEVTIVDEIIVSGLVKKLLADDKLIETLVLRDEHYYKPDNQYINSYLWTGEEGIDLMDHPEFKERFEAIQERNAQVTEADKENVFIEMADHTEFDSVKEVE